MLVLRIRLDPFENMSKMQRSCNYLISVPLIPIERGGPVLVSKRG